MEKLHPKKRYVHISFRVPVEQKNELEEDARKHNTNLNSLGNHIFAKHLFIDRIAEREGVVLLGQQVFARIIDTIPPEEVEKIGKEFGQKVIERAFTLLNLKNDLDSLVNQYIKPMGSYSGWYDFNEVESGPNRRFMLEHHYGYNWSQFIKQYTGKTISSVTGIEPKIDIKNGLVIVGF